MRELKKLIALEQEARDFGFDWPNQLMILDQIIDECREVREVIDKNLDKNKLQEEMGDLLHAVISLIIFSNYNIDETLEKINIKFSRRLQCVKKLAQNRGLENLHGKDINYLLNLWDLAKKSESEDKNLNNIIIKNLTQQDIVMLVKSFQQANWDKSELLFESYLREQQQGERLIWVAFYDNQCAGYVTLKFKSLYALFSAQNIPEIMDLNVLPNYRKLGIGSRLLHTAEQAAARYSNIVGIGVGLYAGKDGGYGAAQKIYIKNGYLPDGHGVTYNYQSIIPRNNYPIDDDLILWFTKNLNINT